LSFICPHNKHWLLLQSKLSWSISKIWSWLFTHLWLDKQDRRLKISLLWHLISSLKTFTVDSNILNKHFSLCCYPSWFQKVLEVACSADIRSDFNTTTHFWTITLPTRTTDFWEFLRLLLQPKLDQFWCSLVNRLLITLPTRTSNFGAAK
jgi:hypothetical protein